MGSGLSDMLLVFVDPLKKLPRCQCDIYRADTRTHFKLQPPSEMLLERNDMADMSVVFLLCWLRTELNLRWVRDRSSFYSFQRERLDTHIQENGGMPV